MKFMNTLNSTRPCFGDFRSLVTCCMNNDLYAFLLNKPCDISISHTFSCHIGGDNEQSSHTHLFRAFTTSVKTPHLSLFKPQPQSAHSSLIASVSAPQGTRTAAVFQMHSALLALFSVPCLGISNIWFVFGHC